MSRKKQKAEFKSKIVEALDDATYMEPGSYEYELVMNNYRKQVTGDVPTVFEMASLVASLSKGKNLKNESLKSLAIQALDLWAVASVARSERIEILATRQHEEAKRRNQEAIDNTPKFPMELDEFMRLMMPKKKAVERIRIYREWLREGMRFDSYMTKHRQSGMEEKDVPYPSDEEVEEIVNLHRSEPYQAIQFGIAASNFQLYLKNYESQIRHKRAKAGSAKRWQKKKRSLPK